MIICSRCFLRLPRELALLEPALNRSRIRAQVLLVGDSAVGKSCLLMRFTADRFDDVTTSTIGAQQLKAVGEVPAQ
jgi:GTPase SAR1 family protein